MKARTLELELSTLAIVLICLLCCSSAFKPKQDFINRFDDVKDFKKFIKTHTNVLVVFSKTEKNFKEVKLLNQVAESIRGSGSVVHIDCTNAKKLCKKLKTNPSSVEYKHFKDGEFHKDYDRMMTFKSMSRFMQAPTGDLPWDEDPSGADVVHVESLGALKKVLTKTQKSVLVMFYAPWCGFCKRLKPDYAAAATILKDEAVLVGMDADTPQGSGAKYAFNISSFPTIILFKNGEKVFDYGGENSKEGIVEWMRNPHPPKPQEAEQEWSEVPSDVVHLNDDNFNDVIKHGQPTLVMFYAPWCGHCKTMKPEYQKAATAVKEMGLGGVLAALDGTKNKKVMDNFTITGFPTVKFFKDGEEQYNMNERTSDKIVEFMKNPQAPKEPEAEEATWEAADSHVVSLTQETFKAFLKKKKHCMVIFYAPWCTHCKRTKPAYMEAAEALKDDNKKAFAAVDCTQESALCQDNGVKGYPTINFYTYGKDPRPYMGGRETKDFIAYMKDPDSTPSASKLSSLQNHWQNLENSQVISLLTSDTFDNFITTNAFVVVTFYGAGCNHCTAMRQDFIEAALQLQREKVNVVFAAVDAIADQAIRTRFSILSLPTTKAFKQGSQLMDFDDIARTKENFVKYVKSPPAAVKTLSPVPPGLLEVTSASHFDTATSQHKLLLVFFYDPSIPHCLRTAATLFQTAPQVTKLGAAIVLVDCVVNKELYRREKVSMAPLFRLYQGAKSYYDFEGSITAEALVAFVKKGSNQAKVEL